MAKTRSDTIDGSATLEEEVVVEMAVESSADAVCEAIAGKMWRDVNANTCCGTAAMNAAKSNVYLFISVGSWWEKNGRAGGQPGRLLSSRARLASHHHSASVSAE